MDNPHTWFFFHTSFLPLTAAIVFCLPVSDIHVDTSQPQYLFHPFSGIHVKSVLVRPPFQNTRDSLQTMSGADCPEILAAYNAVRSNTDPTNWLLISYAGAVGDKLQLAKTGSGGLEELKEELDDSQAQYAYLRLEYANDTEWVANILRFKCLWFVHAFLISLLCHSLAVIACGFNTCPADYLHTVELYDFEIAA